jgi:N-acetylmuramoyl-L-alanine amidase
LHWAFRAFTIEGFRGRGSIRLRVLLALAAVAAGPAPLLCASSDPIVVLMEGQRREVLPVARGDAEYLPLEQALPSVGVGIHSDPAGGAVTLSCQGREVALYNKKSLASVGGELRLMSAPALLEDRIWLVPADSLARLLGPLLGVPVEYRKASRVLVVGNVSVPRVAAKLYVSGDSVRVVLEASEKVPFRVLQEEGRVTVTIARDLVDVSFQQERLTGGIVDLVRFLGGKDNLFAISLGKRFQQLKAFEQDAPARLVLEFQATTPQAAKAAPPPAAPAPPRGATEELALRTVVIDPGHGGAEVGAKGPAGTLEKDVTLAIARKLRASLTGNLGLQVFLTRDGDAEVPLNERTAIANNYKADLFISIHANASRSHGASGSEVYFLSYQASDDESRRVAQEESGAFPVDSSAAPAGSDLALILWDMAQAEHLEESSSLASRLQEELARATGHETRGVKQAPFRVLVGAAMPAVLVEVAFISHPEEEKLLASDAYQGKIAAALTRGIREYQSEWLRRAGLSAATARGGS